MVKNIPHSDKSGRAQRRRRNKMEEKAERVVAAKQNRSVSVNDLLTKIGYLTVENDTLRLEIAQLQEAQANKSADEIANEAEVLQEELEKTFADGSEQEPEAEIDARLGG